MSERGSFTTEYIYCKDCFEAVRKILEKDDKYLKGVQIPMWSGNETGEELPIIAGKIGGLHSGEELETFEFELNQEIAKVICHPVRIAVLAESGERIFTIEPITKDYIGE